MNFTDYAVEAVRQLWMVPHTICDATNPHETLGQAIRRKMGRWTEDQSVASEDHRTFTVSGCAMGVVASRTIIEIAAHHTEKTKHLKDALQQGQAIVEAAFAQVHGPAGRPRELELIMEAVSPHHWPGKSPTCNVKATLDTNWLECRDGFERPTPCLPCHALANLPTPDIGRVYRTEGQTEEPAREIVDGDPFDAPEIGPMPIQTHPSIHALAAIEQIRQMTAMTARGSDTHLNLAYAATAAEESIDWIRDYEQHDGAALGRLLFDPMRRALELTAAILAGRPFEPVAMPDAYPREGEICQAITVQPDDTPFYRCTREKLRRGAEDKNDRDAPCEECPLALKQPNRSAVLATLDAFKGEKENT